MDPDRWKIIEETYHAALEREGEARSGFLDKICGPDAELRREVESLLAEAKATEQFMERERRPLPGRSLNHYRIGSLLGSGGMAEVYRARDTRLERDVAIKVLQKAHFLDPERLRRLHREAKLLASLNHPNIASIYGLEEAGGICALVLELVEGETLAERIARAPLPAEEAPGIAKQIAAGLEAAHAKGIIHRDLKPSNIKIAPDGVVKILDFGLAKLLQPLDDSRETVSGSISREGIVAGTLYYMSPEQARGKPLDVRTDVWSFGCVLYELLAGRPAFQGETPTDVIVKIASEDPDWTRLARTPEAFPAELQRVIRKCLEKKPEERYQSVRDLSADLTAIGSGRSGGHSSASARFPSEAEFVLPGKSARPLFFFAQFGYIALYAAAMYHIDAIANNMAIDFLLPEGMTLAVVIVLAMSGVAVRIFLISSTGWRHPAAGKKFEQLFPAVWLLDSIWAASPLLLWRHLGYGISLTFVATLAYVPFAQRTLMRTMYPARSASDLTK